MPVTISPIDLSTFAVGQSGDIPLSPLYGGSSVTNNLSTFKGIQGVLRLHNDSGSGLLVSLSLSGQQFYVPAGGWQDCYPQVGDTTLAFTVVYVLPNPPVTLLLATYYYPGEPVPAVTILGNSPIGGGVNTNVNSSTLVNTGNPPGTPNVIEIQPSDAASPTLHADNSGNVTIQSDNAGVLTTLLQLIAGVSPEVLIAASGLLTQVLGNLQINGAVGIQRAPAAASVALIIQSLSTSQDGVVVKSTADPTPYMLAVENSAGSVVWHADSEGNTNGVYIDDNAGQSGRVRIGSDASSPGDVLDSQVNGSLFLKAQNGGLTFQSPNGTTRWSLTAIHSGNFSASGTVNHGLNGTPVNVLLCPSLAGSTWTFSAYSFTSTQFSATIASANNTDFFAYR